MIPHPSEHTCRCPTYTFPHRKGGGKCPGAGYVCTSCGDPCSAIQVDFGIGAYECHGFRGIDTQIAIVSDCCEAEAFDTHTQRIEET